MVEKSHTTGFWPSLADPFRTVGSRLAEWIAPASEASGDDDAYRISIELPGVEEKDITLSAENGIVTLKGEKKTEREEKGETWFFSERQYGSFSRSFRLPPDADENKVSADLKNGVLTVKVPKAKAEEKKTRQVKINSA
ncbi:MAG: Hsp20/alpha crystallin family protein [Silicimonas sp.]